LREYPVQLNSDFAGYADVSPGAPEVVMVGPASVPGNNRVFLSIYDYRVRRQPVATLSGRLRVIDWKVGPFGWVVFLRFSPDGRSLLFYDGASGMHVYRLDRGQPTEARVIDLGLSGERPYFQPVDVEWAPDGRRVGVILSFKVFHQGVVRVYDVTTGALLWERSADLVEMGGEAWSPDGRELAVTLLSGNPASAYPPRDIPNLLILDGNSGRRLMGIRTGDFAGPVCFGPGNTVLTAPLHFEPRGRDPSHPDVVSVRDLATGRLLRKIASPGRDIHDGLQISQDGNVLLGYVGKEKSGFSLKALEYIDQVLDRRFQLFDFATGRVITTSPNLTSDGFCRQSTEVWRLDSTIPCLRLAPDGRRVLVYWPMRACTPSVFEVSRAP
jgi:WD40 repeat protein